MFQLAQEMVFPEKTEKFNIVVSTRVYNREKDLYVVLPRLNRQILRVILFNDIILFAQHIPNLNRLSYEAHVSLSNVHLACDPQGFDMLYPLSIICSRERYVIYFEFSAERDVWYDKIHQFIVQLKTIASPMLSPLIFSMNSPSPPPKDDDVGPPPDPPLPPDLPPIDQPI